jgi:hypothetical protein
MSDPFNPFDRALLNMPDEAKRGPIIDVTDTAYLVKLWFDTYAPTATAADIIAMTGLIMERERYLSRPQGK